MKAETELVVAADGSGEFTNVQTAINAVPQNTSPTNWCVILVKPGIYKELIYVQHEKHFVCLRGENAEKTVMTYDLHAGLPGPDGKPISTFRTPSTVIDADDFVAENLTFENSAGPKGQALAVRLDGDRLLFVTAGSWGGRTPFSAIGGGIISRIVISRGPWILFLAAPLNSTNVAMSIVSGTAISLPLQRPRTIRSVMCFHIAGSPAKIPSEDLSGPALAALRERDFSEHGNVRRRTPGRLGQLAGPRA